MKTCACCAALAASAESTCAQCGEASWIECADDRASEPASAPEAPKRKGGR